MSQQPLTWYQCANCGAYGYLGQHTCTKPYQRVQWVQYKPQPPQLPDKFAKWVEEVRRQKRLEELLQCIYDIVMKDKNSPEG